MPFAGFPTFDACEREMLKKHDKESAQKICGYLQAKHEKKDSMINECILSKMNALKDLEDHEDTPLKELMLQAYHECHDFHDFEFLTLEEYDFIRNIAITLQENQMEEYIITNQMILSSLSLSDDFRVEPMLSLAEAATAGARQSSNVGKIGYFNQVLEVEFLNGVRYIYFVDDSFYDDFVAAESKGKWLWENLRGKVPGLVYPGKDPNRMTAGGMKGTGQGGAIVPYARRSVLSAARQVTTSGQVEPLIPKKSEIISQLEQESEEKKGVFGLLKEKAFSGLKFLKTRSLRKPQRPSIKKKVRGTKDLLQDLEQQDDAINELIEWVLAKGLTNSRDEAEEIALLILQARKKKGKDGRGSSKEWEEEWEEIAEIFEKRREKRREKRKNAMNQGDNTTNTIIESGNGDFYYIDENNGENTMVTSDLVVVDDYCGNEGTLEELGMCAKKFHLVHDYFHESNETKKNELKQKIDFHDINIKNDTLLFGTISQAGEFEYQDGIKIKKWDNLVENAKAQSVLPLFGRNGIGSHDESDDTLLGYVDNWILDHERQKFNGFFHTFQPIEELSALRDPKDLSVSLSFYDAAPKGSKYQDIRGLRHVAISLDNTEQDRCSSVKGMGRCIVNKIDLKKKKEKENITTHADLSLMNDSNHISQIPLTSDFEGSSNHSTKNTNGPSKIITQKRLKIDMSKEDELIARILEDFEKQVQENINNDALEITGNERVGNTLEDIFKRACANQNASPEACDAAWQKYNNENNPRKKAPQVSPVTGGHRSKMDMIQIPKEEYDNIMTTIDDLSKQNKEKARIMKQFEDYMEDLTRKQTEAMKQPWLELFEQKEKATEIFSKFDNDFMIKAQAMYDLLIEDHPELVQPMNAHDLAEKNLSDVKKTLKIERQRSDDFDKKIEAIKERSARLSASKPWNRTLYQRKGLEGMQQQSQQGE